mgnify:CR=1 FL=1
MATVEQLTQAVATLREAMADLSIKVSAEAAQVTATIQALKDQIANSGIDPTLLDPILASLTDSATALTALTVGVENIYTPEIPPPAA